MTSGVATGPSPLAGDLRDVTLGTATSSNLFVPPRHARSVRNNTSILNESTNLQSRHTRD